MAPFPHGSLFRRYAAACLAFAVACVLGTSTRAQLVVVNETFTNSTFSSGWQVGGSGYTPTLTASTGLDTPGSGWLRLTDTGGNESTYAVDTNSFASANATIAAKFNYAAYNGTGADGITFFLADASKTFGVGAYGGSLGYAQKTGITGLNGGYIGLGIDEFGNYSNPTEGRVGGIGFQAGNVSIRGPGNGTNGYDYLGGTGSLSTPIAFPTSTTRPTGANARTFEVVITATNQLTVYMQAGTTGTMDALYSIDLSGYARPDNLIMGFTSGTGASTDIHEIQGLSLASQVANIWTNGAGTSPGLWSNGSNWNGSSGQIPAAGADVLFDNHYVSSAQTIDVGTGATRIVRSVQIDAPFSYTLNNGTLEFNNEGILGPSGIYVSQGHGTASHTINSAITLDNDIDVKNTSSGTLTLAGTIANNGNALNFGGSGKTSVTNVVSGTGAVTKSDSGTLALGGANTYSGGTTLNAGTISVSNNAALGSGTLTLNGGTLASTASNTVANAIALQGSAGLSSITTSGTLTQTGGDMTLTMANATHSGTVNLSDTNTAHTLTVEVDSGTSAISGVIQNGGTGAGNLTKAGAGTLTLGGANTYTGTTTINNGTLTLGASDRLADTSSLNIGASGLLNLNTFSEKVGNLAFTGGATIDFGSTTGANTLVFGTLQPPASGVLIVRNFETGNVDTLATTVAGQNVASIYVSGVGTVGEATTATPVTGYGSAFVLSASTINWKTWVGTSTNWGTTTNWSPNGAPTNNGDFAKFSGTATSATATLSANRTLSGLRFDSTAASYTLNGNNKLTMDNTVTGGIAYIQQQSTNAQTLAMTTLNLNKNTIIDITGSGNLSTGTTTVLTGTGNLIKDGTGSGKLILAGNSTGYNANVFINTGAIQISNGGALGTTTGTTTIADGGALELTNNITSAEIINAGGYGVSNGGALRNISGNNTLSGALTLSLDGRINSDAGTLTLSNTVTSTNTDLTLGGAGNVTASNTLNLGSGVLNKDGAGTATLSGTAANTVGGVNVNAGTLVLSKSAGIDAVNGPITIGDGVNLSTTGTLKLGQTNQINDSSAVTINSNGVLNLNGFSETVASLSGSGSLSNASTTAATFAVGDTTSTTFSGTISNGTGVLTLWKQGSGKLTLSGANSYGGGTGLSAGILSIQNGNALGTGNLSITSGANLEVSGGINVTNTMTVNGPGTLANDGAIQSTGGTNTISGVLTLGSNSRINADAGSTLNVTNTVSGTGFGLTLGGNGNINVSGAINTSTGGTLTKDGSGYAVLSGANTFTGATTITGGTLEIRNSAGLGTSAGGVSVASGTTLAVSNNITTAESPITLNGTGVSSAGALRSLSGTNTLSGAVTASTASTIGVDAGTLTLTGAVTGGDVTKVGSGTLTLSGTGANTSNLNVNDGTVIMSKTGVTAAGATLNIGDGNGSANSAVVQFNSTGQVATTTAVTIASDGQLNLNNNSHTIAALSGAGNVALGTGTLTLNQTTNTSFTGAVSGTGAANVVKSGTGTLTIGGTAGSNSFATPTLTLTGGTVQLGASNILNSALVFNGGTLSVNGFNDTVTSATVSANSVIDFNSLAGVFDLSAYINNAGTLTINNWAGSLGGGGASQLKLAGTNGTLINSITFAGYGAGAQILNGELVPKTTGGTYTWNNNGDGNWSTNGNWSPNTGNPNGTDASVIFGAIITANHTVTLDTNRTAGYLTFNDDNNYTVSGANTLTLAVSSGNAQITTSNTGADTISTAVKLSNALTINQNSTGTLTLSGAISSTVTNTAENITVNGAGNTVISGAITTYGGSLTKNNGGTLTLTNTSNSYTGGTTINGGTLAFSNDLNLGATSGAVTLNGGTLNSITNAVTLSSTRALTVNSGGGTFQTDSNLTYGGVLAGAGAITKTGAGSFITNGTSANTQSGSLTINAGTFEIGKSANVSAIGDSSAVSIASGAILRFNGTSTYTAETIGSLAGAGTVTNASTNTLALTVGNDNTSTTFSGAIQNTGGALSLTKVGTGTLTLTDTAGASNYTGTTTVSAGVVNVQASTALGNTSGSVSVSSGAALQVQNNINLGTTAVALNGTGISNDGALRNISGNNTLGGAITLSGTNTKIESDSGTLTLSGAVSGAAQNLILDGAGNITMSGAIGTTTGTLTKNGTGYATLSGANTYSGATAINAGTLEIQNNAGLGTSAGGTTVSSGATLALSNNITTAETPISINGQGVGSAGALRSLSGTNTISGAVTLAGSSIVGVDSGSLTVSGVVSGTGMGLTKVGAGTLVLGNSGNTYTGGTTVSAGTVQINADTALGTAPTTATAGNITLNGGTLATMYSGALNTNRGVAIGSSGGTINTNTSTTLTYGGVMAGTGDFTKSGGGTLVLSGANTFTGATNLNGGTLSINADARLGTASGNGINFNGGTLATTASMTLDASRSITVGAGGGTLNVASGTTLSYGGLLSGTGALTFMGGGTLSMTASNDFSSGTLLLNGGTFSLLNANLSVGTFHITGSTTLDFGGSASRLDVNNFIIDAGATVTITGWVNGSDYFTAQNWTGATLGTRGTGDETKITFDPPTYTNSQTAWQSWDHEITPVPEPRLFGIALLAACVGAFLWRRSKTGDDPVTLR